MLLNAYSELLCHVHGLSEVILIHWSLMSKMLKDMKSAAEAKEMGEVLSEEEKTEMWADIERTSYGRGICFFNSMA